MPSWANPITRPTLLLGTARSRGTNLRRGGSASACDVDVAMLGPAARAWLLLLAEAASLLLSIKVIP